MASFLFNLTRAAGDAEVWMVFDALHARFPEHSFSPVELNEPDLENTIVPMIEDGRGRKKGCRSARVDLDLIDDVEAAFQELISAAGRWKPS